MRAPALATRLSSNRRRAPESSGAAVRRRAPATPTLCRVAETGPREGWVTGWRRKLGVPAKTRVHVNADFARPSFPAPRIRVNRTSSSRSSADCWPVALRATCMQRPLRSDTRRSRLAPTRGSKDPRTSTFTRTPASRRGTRTSRTGSTQFDGRHFPPASVWRISGPNCRARYAFAGAISTTAPTRRDRRRPLPCLDDDVQSSRSWVNIERRHRTLSHRPLPDRTRRGVSIRAWLRWRRPDAPVFLWSGTPTQVTFDVWNVPTGRRCLQRAAQSMSRRPADQARDPRSFRVQRSWGVLWSACARSSPREKACIRTRTHRYERVGRSRADGGARSLFGLRLFSYSVTFASAANVPRR